MKRLVQLLACLFFTLILQSSTKPMNERKSALKYIKNNIAYHTSFSNPYSEYCEKSDSLFLSGCDFITIRDSLKSLSQEYRDSISKINDSNIITEEFLKDAVNYFLHMWHDKPWNHHLTFDQFCEYLLPYKLVDGQPLKKWWEDLSTIPDSNIENYEIACWDFQANARVMAWYAHDDLIRNNTAFLYTEDDSFPIFDPEILCNKPYGNCFEFSFTVASILRSIGIPVSIDYTPQWPDREMGHYWNTVLSKNGHNLPFDSFGTNPSTDFFPDAKFAKVYRKTFAPNKLLLKKTRRGHELPPLLQDIFFRDVTNEYTSTSDVKIHLFKNARRGHNVYLSVFDNHQWRPITWGKRLSRTRAVFTNIGREVTYLPVLWEDGHIIPIGDPFRLELNGDVCQISLDTTTTTSVHITRKFPLFRHVAIASFLIRFGRIEAANKKDFSDAVTISDFPDWYICSDTINVARHGAFRYWRYIGSNGFACSDIAELYFWKNGSRIKGTLISSGDISITGNPENIQDNELLTNYSARYPDCWVGYDFGDPISIDHISYVRRGDGNNVFPEADFQLSYWDRNHWVIIENKTANDVFVDFNNVPSSGLLYIQGLSYGTQNRIFEYRNGQQCWR